MQFKNQFYRFGFFECDILDVKFVDPNDVWRKCNDLHLSLDVHGIQLHTLGKDINPGCLFVHPHYEFCGTLNIKDKSLQKMFEKRVVGKGKKKQELPEPIIEEIKDQQVYKWLDVIERELDIYNEQLAFVSYDRFPLDK